MGLTLVTGGAGFIGSHLVRGLLAAGHPVRVLDDFSTGRRENLAEVAPRIEIHEGDVRDPAAVARAVAGCEAVLHHAAIASVERSVAEPLLVHDVNAGGTLLLLEACRAARVRRFVYASSSAVYGDAPGLPKTEQMPPGPVSPYAASKAAGELYAAAYRWLHGMATVSLRYFNIFGPRQDPASPYAAAVPRFVTAVLGGRRPVVFGDGEQTRDFTPVGNVVAANLLALGAPEEAWGEAFNIGIGEAVTVNDLLARIGEIAGVAAAAEHAPPRAGDVRRSLASIEKARRTLGYEPAVGLDAGLRETIAFLRGAPRA